MIKKLEECYNKSIDVLEDVSTQYGFYASGGAKGYKGVWARDSMITSIGASLLGERFKKEFKRSLLTLTKHQGKLGQIPNAVLKLESKKPQIDFLSIDSSLWFIIGQYTYKEKYGREIFKENIIKKTLNWLACQDWGNNYLLIQLPTTDWQDAFPHKYGYTIYTHALYYKVLNLIGKKKEAEKVKKLINYDKDVRLWNKNFYLPWRWKNHNQYKELETWFDSFGNLLAIIFELADKKRGEKILNYIKEKKINRPFPIKAIYPPIKKGQKGWHDYFEDCDARKPYNYSNAGIWPFIGSFYVLALIKFNKLKEAEKELLKVAEENLEGNFPEWIHPKTKKMYGYYQAWNAGSYILAYKSLINERCLF